MPRSKEEIMQDIQDNEDERNNLQNELYQADQVLIAAQNKQRILNEFGGLNFDELTNQELDNALGDIKKGKLKALLNNNGNGNGN